MGSRNRRHLRHFAQSPLRQEEGSRQTERAVVYISVAIMTAFLGWATITSLDEVAVAPGVVTPTASVHVAQHLTGGLVEKLFVREGSHVRRGQPLLKIDADQKEAELELAQGLVSTLTRRKKHLDDEFRTRRQLVAHGYSSELSILPLKGSLAELNGRLTDTRARIQQLKEEISELTLRAPVTGRVHTLNVNRQAAVVKSGERLFEIIPEGSELEAQIQIAPSDIAHIAVGQPVSLKFDAFDFARYGGINAVLDAISPSTVTAPDGTTFYRGTITIKSPFIKIHGHPTPILPGMTMQASIKTGSKTIMEYLLKPVLTSAQAALHER